ncbi:hypothetical protein Holit_02997 [Hollandina sp. SP2]
MLVAPHAGAWIETEYKSSCKRIDGVAPHAGAWIETDSHVVDHDGIRMSHPTRVRGLKRIFASMMVYYLFVAPHAGAWIETVILPTIVPM